MTNNLKALGLALAAAFAMSAVAAPVAQAEVLLTGEQIAHGGNTKHTLTTSGGDVVSCSTPTLPGTIDEKQEAVTITPVYAGCVAKIGASELPATITMNGCDYLFEAGEEDKARHFAGGMADLACPESKRQKWISTRTKPTTKRAPFSARSRSRRLPANRKPHSQTQKALPTTST